MGATLSKAVIGWAALAAAGYFFYNWYSRDNRRAVKGRPKGRSTSSSLAKVAGSSDSQSGTDRSSTAFDSLDQKKKKKKSQKVKDTNGGQKPSLHERPEKATPATTTVTNAESDDDKHDNLEFARQLQSAKLGTSMARPSKNGVPPASKNQTRDNVPSATNDTNGLHQDDPPVSQSIAETEDRRDQGRASGISDMLEAPSAGPSILRITEPEFQTATRKKSAAIPAQQAETKKQRQNRQKNEERKAAREEEEQARRALMEKQRRTAREAEGRAAKDGSTFVPAMSVPSSVWVAPQSQSNGNGNAAATGVRNNDLLDTFDPTKMSSSSGAVSTPSAVPQSTSWQTALPSEEEQMRQLQGDDAWATVTSKKTKKAGSGKTSLPMETDSTKSNGSGRTNVTQPNFTPAAPSGMSSTAPLTDSGDLNATKLSSHQPDQKNEVPPQHTPVAAKWAVTQLFQDDEWEVA